MLLEPRDGSTLAAFTGDRLTGFLFDADDLDGDEQGDVVLGDDYGNPWGSMAGAVYVSYAPFSGTIAVSDTTGSLADGVVHGAAADDWLAYRHTISVPGDVDGDGGWTLGCGGVDELVARLTSLGGAVTNSGNDSTCPQAPIGRVRRVGTPRLYGATKRIALSSIVAITTDTGPSSNATP